MRAQPYNPSRLVVVVVIYDWGKQEDGGEIVNVFNGWASSAAPQPQGTHAAAVPEPAKTCIQEGLSSGKSQEPLDNQENHL